MNEPMSLDTVTRRLERLEREHRRWKAIGVASLALLGLLGGLGSSTTAWVASEVRAKRFVVVDDNGRKRAELRGDTFGIGNPDRREPLVRIGHSALVLYDGEERPALLGAVDAHEGAPLLALLDRTGIERAALSLRPSGRAELTLFHRAGRQSVRLTDAFLLLASEGKDTGVAALWAQADGGTGLELTGGAEGRERVNLRTFEDKTVLTMRAGVRDPAVLRRLEAELTNVLDARLRASLAQSLAGSNSIALTVTSDVTSLDGSRGSSLVLSDGSDKVVWKAP